jgi:hypothetical protein
MIFRFLAGFLGGALFSIAVLYLMCGFLAPGFSLCGHNTPVSAILLWAAGSVVTWVLLAGMPGFRKRAKEPPDYHY